MKLHLVRCANAALMAVGLAIGQAGLPAAAHTSPGAPAQHGASPHAPGAVEAQTYKVRVTIESIRATNNFDGPFLDLDSADFFAVVAIATSTQSTPVASNQQNPRPNWEVSADWTVADLGLDLIGVTIDIRDSDGCGTAPGCGDQADITPAAPGRNLLLLLDLSECALSVSGAIKTTGGANFGNCGQSIFTAGATGSGTSNTAELTFKVSVDRPVTAPGLNVRAMHNSIWPAGGESVTISAEALDDTEALGPKLVERIQIFVDSVRVRTCAAAATCNFVKVAPPAGGSFSYKVDVVDGASVVSTGWRRVQVGQPPEGRAVPVVFTGPRASRIDIAFAPDALSTYAGASAALFQTDVSRMVSNGFYGTRWLLKNQDKFNFWIAQDPGVARGFPQVWPTRCVDGPPNQGSDYAFAESVAVVHRTRLRDCAYPGQRIFSAPFDSPDVVLHEAGHAAFGIADEYCCDSNYFEPSPFPNIYASLANCQADAPNLVAFDRRNGVPDRTAASCRQIANGTSSIGYFRSDPNDDLMLNLGRIQGADLRRMEWVLGACAIAACRSATSTQSWDQFERALDGPPISTMVRARSWLC